MMHQLFLLTAACIIAVIESFVYLSCHYLNLLFLLSIYLATCILLYSCLSLIYIYICQKLLSVFRCFWNNSNKHLFYSILNMASVPLRLTYSLLHRHTRHSSGSGAYGTTGSSCWQLQRTTVEKTENPNYFCAHEYQNVHIILIFNKKISPRLFMSVQAQ